jgi:hypothetical protein
MTSDLGQSNPRSDNCMGPLEARSTDALQRRRSGAEIMSSGAKNAKIPLDHVAQRSLFERGVRLVEKSTIRCGFNRIPRYTF